MPGEEIGPDYDVPIFDVSEPGIDVFLFWIRLRRGQNPIEVGGVGFILPMVLERVDVDRGRCGRSWCGAGLQGGRHSSISPPIPAFARIGNPRAWRDVLFDRTT